MNIIKRVLRSISYNVHKHYELGYDAQMLLEIKEYLLCKSNNRIVRFFKSIKYNKICKRNCAFIRVNTAIGKDTVFPHGISGVFISQNATIGDNCVIFQQVTIGSNTLSDSEGLGAPKIGNNVYIGAGAKIIGNVNIEDNVRIGANAIVTKNIPANSTVVMAHPRIISYENSRDNTFRSITEK